MKRDPNYGRVTVLNYGYVKLLDVMGTDEDIVDAARISYDRRGKTKDRALIRYLLRNRHTSPFEMGVLKFELKMPIFVARQWVRHRTASMNEVSARYTELPEEMFSPEVVARQSKDNKQGREELPGLEYSTECREVIFASNRLSYRDYKELLDKGVSRELARGVLPLNIYTKFVWKMDLHNLMHFLKLRLHPHAQQEIREYAKIIEGIVRSNFPITHEAFVDYSRDAYICSRMEVELFRLFMSPATRYNRDQKVKTVEETLSSREAAEFIKTFL